MKTPIFSVIMPVYNREETIESVVHAILNQTFEDFELVIVDDGSSDSTRSKITKLSDNRIKLISQKNGRQTQARRRACAEANGKYFAFCDSDDIWHPEFLETLFRAFKEYDADYIFTNYQVQGEAAPRIQLSGEETEKWLKKYSTEISGGVYKFSNLYLALLDYQPIFTSCQAITASHYFSIGGISDRINNVRNGARLTSEDSHIIRRSALTNNSIFLNKNLVTLGRQGDNTSHSYVSNVEGGLTILIDIIETTTLTEEQKKRTKQCIKNHQKELAKQLYYAEKYAKFIKFYLTQNPLNLASRTHAHFYIAVFRLLFLKSVGDKLRNDEKA